MLQCCFLEILHHHPSGSLWVEKKDPNEFEDLGADPAYEDVRRELHEVLFWWLRRRKLRTKMSSLDIKNKLGKAVDDKDGILIGYW